MTTRQDIVAAARAWIGTPYHNCADVLGVGVDCGMLLVRCYVDAGLAPAFDPRPYAPDFHLHRDEERYLGFVLQHGREVERPGLGDVAVYRIGRCWAHGGIVSVVDPLTLVHAWAPARRVLEQPLAENGRLSQPSRQPRYFTFWGA